MFKLGVYACLGLFVSWVLLLILQLWFSFVDADLFLKITLTMAGLFIIILASLLVISQYFSEKKMKDDGFINLCYFGKRHVCFIRNLDATSLFNRQGRLKFMFQTA